MSQPDFGVVFYLPDDKTSDADVLATLAEIKREGYRHINVSSWIWTDLSPKSGFRRRMALVLNWCDLNDLSVWVLENIQYGGGEGGDFERGVADAAGYVQPLVTNWVDTLHGHACVRGFILGNEVGPAIPNDPTKVPLYTHAFTDWLQRRYTRITALNITWGTTYSSFDAIGFPAEKTPGRVDLRQFADERFGQFYSDVFNKDIKPTLGAHLGYASKTAPDPYLYRVYPGATMLGYDDLVANEPLWILRVLADCDPRPLFDSEIHLYNDGYQFYPSPELTRYRYLADMVTGESANSSFAWGMWQKPEIAAIHAQTSVALREAARVAPQIALFSAATRTARVGVLVTRPLLDQSSGNLTERPVLPAGANVATLKPEQIAPLPTPLEDAYAALGTTGKPWRYVLDLDLPTQGRKLDTLIVPGSDTLPATTLKSLIALPRSVQVEWGGQWPSVNEYHQPLDAASLGALKSRCHLSADLSAATIPYQDKSLSSLFTATAVVGYGWWSPQRGSFGFGVRYPRIEARKSVDADGATVVLLINNTRDKQTIPAASQLPWLPSKGRIYDVTAQAYLPPESPVVLPPFDVHLFNYEKQKR